MTEELPEWIQVWRWYRHTQPQDRRPFPQQEHYAGDELLDYELVRQAWLERTIPSSDATLAKLALSPGTVIAFTEGEEAAIDAAVGESDGTRDFLAFISDLPPVPP